MPKPIPERAEVRALGYRLAESVAIDRHETQRVVPRDIKQVDAIADAAQHIV